MSMRNFWSKAAREAPDNPGSGAEPVAPAEPAQEAEPGPDLSFIPADFIVDGKPDLGKFASHYQELAAGQRPPPPEAYDFAIPKDMTYEGMPEGFGVDLATDDPAFQPIFTELGSFLKEVGAPAEAGAKVSSLIAKYEAAKYAKGLAALQEEAKALGTPAQAQARVGAVLRKLETMLPADQVEALTSIASSAKAVIAIEKLIGPQSLSSPVPQPQGSVKDDLAAYYATPTRKS